MATILIVEDEPAIVELIRVTLEADRHTIIEAGSAEEARQKLALSSPDLLLLDWMLPGQSGLAFAKSLRDHTRTKQLPIIMVTARAEESDKISGLEHWVDDYVTKPFSPRELKARVKAVLRRRAPELCGEVLRSGELMLDPDTHRASYGNKVLNLGPLEYRLLYFLVARSGRTFNRERLLDAVWGQDSEVEERTVDVVVRRVRQALAPFNMDDRLETVRSVGYRWSDD
jgi:two-component system phosphate regulon response regulator PhoB